MPQIDYKKELKNAFKINVVKLEKGNVQIEYLASRWGAWHEMPKKFKSVTEANNYVAIALTS